MEALDGVDDLLEDYECLKISRVRTPDVARLGVYRGRSRDEDVWSFSDRPGIPELKLVGVKGGVGQCPRSGFALRLEAGSLRKKLPQGTHV